ncbi:NIPSNAP family protein [Pseudoduganella sp. FT26W]|uniref:NIPSNAP family protein n=1 Tax=Duganella aquatilis TaxID=2666082 RepID=A0A844D7P4_9BURK|nr:NIPSNAP family protein [Duganella aquatilis]MRW84176.1 NIPSNAP family protein [Duganella aquatilis]
MFYEMRTYTLQPGKLKEYLRHFEAEGLPVISRYATLVGYWHTEIGELNQLVSIWAYDSLDERSKRRAALYEDQDWLTNFVPKTVHLLLHQESKLLLATSFSPIQ